METFLDSVNYVQAVYRLIVWYETGAINLSFGSTSSFHLPASMGMAQSEVEGGLVTDAGT